MYIYILYIYDIYVHRKWKYMGIITARWFKLPVTCWTPNRWVGHPSSLISGHLKSASPKGHKRLPGGSAQFLCTVYIYIHICVLGVCPGPGEKNWVNDFHSNCFMKGVYYLQCLHFRDREERAKRQIPELMFRRTFSFKKGDRWWIIFFWKVSGNTSKKVVLHHGHQPHNDGCIDLLSTVGLPIGRHFIKKTCNMWS